jgi:hypothetical protein
MTDLEPSQFGDSHQRSGAASRGQLTQLLSYVAVCGWLIWLAISEKSESQLATKLDRIIFTDFFGYFLISLLFSKADQSVRWGWPPTFAEGLKIAGYLLVIVVAGWFMEGAAGWPFTIIWMAGLVMSLSDIASLRTGAIVRVVWALVSGFLVALVASMAGVPEDALLEDHVPSLFAWGLLYFGGTALFRLVRLLAVDAE